MLAVASVDTFIEILEALDFSHAQPCEHSCHARKHKDEPAMYLVHVSTCKECGSNGHGNGDYFLCSSGWEGMAIGVRCESCRDIASRPERLTIVRVIGG